MTIFWELRDPLHISATAEARKLKFGTQNNRAHSELVSLIFLTKSGAFICEHVMLQISYSFNKQSMLCSYSMFTFVISGVCFRRKICFCTLAALVELVIQSNPCRNLY